MPQGGDASAPGTLTVRTARDGASERIRRQMGYVATLLARYGLPIVFLNVLLEQGGFPLPALPTLMTAAALSGGSSIQLMYIVVAGTAASLIADIAWYWGGGRYGRRILGLLCKITISPDSCVRQTEAVFIRFGPWSLLFSKFVPGLSNINVALAGVARVGLTRFLLLDGLGALIFVSVPVIVGHIFRNAIANILDTLAVYGKWGVVGVVLAFGSYFALRWGQRLMFIRQLRMDRITVSELRRILAQPEQPLLLDVRPRAVQLQDGTIPGAISAHPNDLDPLIADYPREVEIVVYCSCPNEASAALAARHLKRAGFKRIRPLLGGVAAWIDAGHAVTRPA